MHVERYEIKHYQAKCRTTDCIQAGHRNCAKQQQKQTALGRMHKLRLAKKQRKRTRQRPVVVKPESFLNSDTVAKANIHIFGGLTLTGKIVLVVTANFQGRSNNLQFEFAVSINQIWY